MVILPPPSYLPASASRPLQYYSLSYEQLQNFEYGFPPGIILSAAPSNSPSGFGFHGSSMVESSEPTPATSTFPSLQSYDDTKLLLTPLTDVAMSGPGTPVSATYLHKSGDAQVSIAICARPASSLGCRYSAPGDASTVYHGRPIQRNDPMVWISAADCERREECRLRLGIKGREYSKKTEKSEDVSS